MTQNMLIAILFGICGLLIGVRHILLLPGHDFYPSAAFRVRIGLFSLAAVLGAMSVLFWFHRESDVEYAGRASPFVAIMLGFLALHAAVQLWSVIRQRQDPRYLSKARVVSFSPHFAEHAIPKARSRRK